MEYDTRVLFKDDYDGYLAGHVQPSRETSWGKQRGSTSDENAIGSAGSNQGQVGGEDVYSRGLREANAASQEEQASIDTALDMAKSELPKVSSVCRSLLYLQPLCWVMISLPNGFDQNSGTSDIENALDSRAPFF